jgi:hypothetical protein
LVYQNDAVRYPAPLNIDKSHGVKEKNNADFTLQCLASANKRAYTCGVLSHLVQAGSA